MPRGCERPRSLSRPGARLFPGNAASVGDVLRVVDGPPRKAVGPVDLVVGNSQPGPGAAPGTDAPGPLASARGGWLPTAGRRARCRAAPGRAVPGTGAGGGRGSQRAGACYGCGTRPTTRRSATAIGPGSSVGST